MSKEFKEFNYNNINKFIGDYKKKGKRKKILSKTINLNNINNNNFNKKINKYKNHKSSSCISISESEMPEKNNEQYSDISDDKLIIKTTLLKNNETRNNNNNINDEQNKYNKNFELLSNAGINNNININMTFI